MGRFATIETRRWRRFLGVGTLAVALGGVTISLAASTFGFAGSNGYNGSSGRQGRPGSSETLVLDGTSTSIKIRRSTPPIAEGLGGGEATGGSRSLKPRKQIFIF